MPPENTNNDHDLLIRIDEKLRLLQNAFDGFKISNEKKNGVFEHNIGKIENIESTSKDHEGRIRRLERWGSIAIGILLVIELIIKTSK